ncbi:MULTISPECIES: NUDIX domain-containing protein [Amycolatopsis]|uniref:NUDIX domain-containing protein n=1 Tax=Amycolatopsis dendrobii TaxID=2760662 RepID=A0A7W3VVL0_9PSEU|nr:MULTISPECIES: NUDIX domain-containing protein [Amycolatopsis]MBB1154043.1 NUDIX domain-containing protein [Amycolatopsis dendrobii]UKD51579.1 NUDIX domain-containing protein [Amycolatopsis sp. FU40]
MVRRSAGVLVYRRGAGGVEVLLAHMGGPFWAKKDLGAWSLPKGEIEEGEEAEGAARREFAEELGVPVPDGEWVALGEVRQSGKVVTAWAVEGDLDPADVVPGVFEMEWPPRSGVMREFPEVDRVEWVSLEVAREKLVKGQRGFLDRVAGL